MDDRPSGTVTFLFTDIEGSTKLWEAHPAAMRTAFARQEAIMRSAIDANSGYAYKMVGDAFQVAFPTAPQALQATLDAQRALHAENWSKELGEVRVRMALHTGVTEVRAGDYVGPLLNRVARLLSAGHGGQVLLTRATYELARDILPAGITLRDIGEHRLRDLTRPEHVFQLVAPDLPSEFPPLKTLDNRPHNLPLQPTPLIGRERELDEVEKLLGREEVRLVTLTGAGGSGKTRLGLQVASDLLDDFADGVWFVDLATLREHSLVVPTIAAVLSVKEEGSTPVIDTLEEYLRNKHLLLLLDNFEHVADAAPQVSQLIGSASGAGGVGGVAGLKVLVTSREPLRIRWEKVYPVPSLSVPDVQHLPPPEHLIRYDAVRLFIERATDVRPDFEVTDQNAPAVAEICARLDGLPLAIELAAARVRMLSPQALLGRLSQRLDVLTGGARDLPTRQQTLRNTMEWSYDLLEEGEKQLFRRMAPFSGGQSLEALEAVCNYDGQLAINAFEGVGSLLSKNLLRQVEVSVGEPRFWMLETIHEYALEKLQESGEAAALHREHARYFMTLAEAAEPALTGKNQAEWYNRLEVEHDNMRAALRWAREVGQEGEGEGANEAGEVGLRIAGAMGRFWFTRGYYSEGREQVESLLQTFPALGTGPALGGKERVAGRNAARAKGLLAEGLLTYRQGDYAAARSASEEALSIGRELGDKRRMALSLCLLGNVAFDQGNYQAARSIHEQSLALFREVGDKRGVAGELDNLGLVAYRHGDYQLARSHYEQSLALFREVGDRSGTAWSLSDLGTMAYAQGDYPTARSQYEQSLVLVKELGDKSGTAWLLGNLGNVAYSEGDYLTARSLHKQSLALFREVGDRPGAATRLVALGAVEVEAGVHATPGMEGRGEVERMEHAERGARLLGAAEGLLAAIGAVVDLEDRIPYEQGVASARSLLGEEALEKAKEEGRAMSMEQAIEYALEEI